MAALITVLVLLDLLVIGGATGLFRALMGAGSAARGGIAGRVPGLLGHCKSRCAHSQCGRDGECFDCRYQ